MSLAPSLALVNGKIWTVNAGQPWAEAVAILNDKILAVGTNDEIRSLLTAESRIIDLQGNFALPGFNDAHLHFADGSFALQCVKLRDAATEEEFVRRIAAYAQNISPGTWILRGNWNHENWPNQQLPTRALIDPVTPYHPVFVNRIDDHIALANSCALNLAGITRATPNPPGGEIKKDPATGEPTGILVDKAWDLMLRVIPPYSFEQTTAAILLGLAEAARYGVTSFQDNSSAMDFGVYQRLLKENKLTARVSVWRGIDLLDDFIRSGIQANFGNDMLRIGTLKVYVDGSMGAGSALFYEAYEDDPSTCGLAILEEAPLHEVITRADAAGLQLAIHAIGDRANTLALDALEAAYHQNSAHLRRHRIEHCQVVTPEDMKRYRSLGVIASVQPSHCIDDMAWAEKRIGHDRCRYAYRVGSFLKHGIPMAFGTDWAVESLNPMLGLYAAVTREFITGGPEGGWFPQEKITIEQAIEAYTLGAAFAEFAEQKKGSLVPGKLADIVVLSNNLLAVPPREYLATEVLWTIMNGKVIYQKESHEI
ncbi:MAG: amidohydrolase [candidate division KSB1 bacterium]|nr:amidohydrolase [candidate division KSB1 bacterium]MDZ7319321.1 amidohydrolase [candidate division KSB1 bacterium]MDZ7340478.1 amidohydrolase [candidate division KSB1 bacterium]